MSTNRHEPLVTPRYEREADSITGAFYVVLDQCIVCGLPPETAPANITWDAEYAGAGCDGCPQHCRVSKQPETDEELELMIEATEGSCIQAIRYCGTDEYTLNQFKMRGIPEVCDAIPPTGRITVHEAVSRPKKAWWKFWASSP